MSNQMTNEVDNRNLETSKKPYTTPRLTNMGTMAKVVQFNGGVGTDYTGGTEAS